MTNPEIVSRFLKMLQTDPETSGLYAMVAPFTGGAAPDQIVVTLDKLAGMWSAARGPLQ